MPHFDSTGSQFPITSRNINNSIVNAFGKMKNGQQMAMLFKEDELSGRAFETLAKTLGFGAVSYVHFRISKFQGRGTIKFRNCIMVSLDEKNAAADKLECRISRENISHNDSMAVLAFSRAPQNPDWH